MPKLSSGRHTAGSIRQVVVHLQEIIKQIEHAAAVLETVKHAHDVEIMQETSLVDGVKFIQQWADCARDAVRDLKINATKNGVPAKSDTSPIGKKEPQKSTSNSLQKPPIKKVADT
jgi:hypothetical protein